MNVKYSETAKLSSLPISRNDYLTGTIDNQCIQIMELLVRTVVSYLNNTFLSQIRRTN